MLRMAKSSRGGRASWTRDWFTLGGIAVVVAVVVFAAYALFVSMTREDVADSGPAYTPPVQAEQTPLRVAAFGDSITAPKGGWLDSAVSRAGGQVVANASEPGSRTPAFVERIPTVDAADPNVVVILGGTNDVYTLDAAETMGSITTIGDHYAQAGDTVILGTIPPRNVHTAEQLPLVDALNAQIVGLAQARGWSVIDFHSVLANGDVYIDGLTSDDVHPNVQGISKMTEAAWPVFYAARQPVA